MRILVLILASDTDIYRAFQERWLQYMNLNPDIHCYFYRADPTIDVPIRVIGNNIIVRMEESFDNIYAKTVQVFRHLHDRFYEYDYILRTNVSSFFRFDKYLEACKTFPTRNFCSACVGTAGDGQKFPSGAGFTITPDVARLIATHPLTPIHLDDVSIGKTLQLNGIRITPASRYDLKLGENIREINTDVYHYRVKTVDRHQDLVLYDTLIKEYYSELR